MMEKKKKREKASTNGASGVEIEGGSVQQNCVPPSIYKAIRPAAPVDLLKRQREVDQQAVGGPAKKLLLSGPAAPVLPFSPTQPYPPVGHWQYPPTQQPPPFVPPAQPQPTVSQGQPLQPQVQQPQSQQQQTQQQQGVTQGAPQQGQAQAQAGQPPTPYWGGSDFPPHSSAGQYYSFPGTTDPNWQGPTYPGAPGVPNSLPYGYPGPYAYPAAGGQTGYTGTWPDQSWWAGNPAQQPPVFPGGYGSPYQGYGPAYGYVPPPGATGAPPLPFQRGYIKAPPGLSQKHQRLWETQSCENIHLWGSLARAEAELGALRNKVLHLEGELHALRGHQDVPGDALSAPPGLLQSTKRGRHKKPVGAINSDPGGTKRGRKPVLDKPVIEGTAKSEDKSDEKECDVDDKNLGTPGKGVRKEKTKLVSDVDENKVLFGSTPVRNVFEPDICAAETSHTLDGASKMLVYGDSYRSTYHSGLQIPNGVNGETHAVEKTGSVVNMGPNSSSYGVKIEGHSDEPAENDCHLHITPGSVEEDWTASDDRNCSFEDRLLYDSGTLVRSDRKVIQEWGEYGGEDVSDEHEADELVPSGQDDEEDIDDDDDSGLRSIGGTKVHDLVIGLASGKGISPLSRW